MHDPRREAYAEGWTTAVNGDTPTDIEWRSSDYRRGYLDAGQDPNVRALKARRAQVTVTQPATYSVSKRGSLYRVLRHEHLPRPNGHVIAHTSCLNVAFVHYRDAADHADDLEFHS